MAGPSESPELLDELSCFRPKKRHPRSSIGFRMEALIEGARRVRLAPLAHGKSSRRLIVVLASTTGAGDHQRGRRA